jgi:prolipoprotein diacylglyceryltransferase
LNLLVARARDSLTIAMDRRQTNDSRHYFQDHLLLFNLASVAYPKVFDIYGNVIGSEAYLEQLRALKISAADTWSLPVHPVPVYESTAMFIVAVAMFMLWKRRILPGRLMFAFGGTYAVWRFAAEFVRVEARLVGPFTIYQVINIGVLAACITACLFLKCLSQPTRQT